MGKIIGSEISGEFVKMKKKVHDSYPSIFTKEDVIVLLVDLEQKVLSHETEENETSTSTNVDYKELVDRIKDRVKEAIEEYDFEDNTTLDLSYHRQIDVSVETDELVRNCKHEIDETLEDYLEELEEENEVEVED